MDNRLVVGGDTRVIGRSARVVGAAHLAALYVIAVALLPAGHALGELLERRGCAACPAVEEPAPLALATLDRPIQHSHPLHDESRCEICASSSLPVISPPNVVAAPPGAGQFHLAVRAFGRPFASCTSRRERARAPPLTSLPS
jgi:hypothetical protein